MKNEKFLLRPKLVRNIRILPLGSIAEEVYKFPKSYEAIGTRYTDKFRGINLLIQGNNIFNIHFQPNIKDGDIVFSDENKLNPFGKGRQEVTVGVNPKKFNALSEEEQNIFIIKLIAKIFEIVNSRYPFDLAKVRETETSLLEGGEMIEFLYKTKETSKYKVAITYQVRLPREAECFVEVLDKSENGKSFKIKLPMGSYYDLFYIVRSINLRGKDIILKSSVAKLPEIIAKKYKLPLTMVSGEYNIIFKLTEKSFFS